MIDWFGICASFAAEIGLYAVKDKLTSIHDANEIKKEIFKFAERQFENKYKYLSLHDEIDYGGIQEYLVEKLPDQIKIYLFDYDQDWRARCKMDILTKAYEYTDARNDSQKKEIRNFINTALNIAKNYYVGKLDGKYEYSCAAEPPVRCGVSHLSGPLEPGMRCNRNSC
jgi:hypothetical protein